ncbi:unnamed protein product [Rotaria magnacalcarata]|uniref:Uncharacterized protein n=1 Tax=Rotaria magnacalcarata TaxID=392030 RepID=A0A819XKI4_9BILA|nr:unnamed protein product [Rotaria magnacalcarata]
MKFRLSWWPATITSLDVIEQFSTESRRNKCRHPIIAVQSINTTLYNRAFTYTTTDYHIPKTCFFQILAKNKTDIQKQKKADQPDDDSQSYSTTTISQYPTKTTSTTTGSTIYINKPLTVTRIRK